MNPGDHIKVSRFGYSHHGIYVGNDEVIHYAGEKTEKINAIVRRDSTAAFADGGTIEVVIHDGDCHSPEETALRAESSLGRKDYDFIDNNCEHFALWCKTGKAECNQNKRVVATAAGGFVGRQIAKHLIVRGLGIAAGPAGWIINAVTAVSTIAGFVATTDKSKESADKSK